MSKVREIIEATQGVPQDAPLSAWAALTELQNYRREHGLV
jgi:hypothetical protein